MLFTCNFSHCWTSMAEWKRVFVLLLPLTLGFGREVMKTIGREPDATPICTNTTELVITLIVCKIHTERIGDECRLLYRHGEGFEHECDSRFTLMMENQTVFLHLTSLTPVDSGNYTCECSYNGGMDVLHLSVTVEIPEEDVSEAGDTSWSTPGLIQNALIGLIIVISVTIIILGFIYRGIYHRIRPEPLSSFPITEPEDIEPYSTITQRESGIYSTVSLHNINHSHRGHTFRDASVELLS